jgi:hypothetical protein
VFYLMPTLLLWAAWVGWEMRLPLAAWWRTLLAAVLAGAVFVAPGLVRNWLNYGDPFGPADFVSMHHRTAGGQLLRKTGLNLGSSLVQTMEPNSQPPGLQGLARTIGGSLSGLLPTHDPFSYEDLNRRETLQVIMQRTKPDADVSTFGVLGLGLFFLGAIGSLGSHRMGAGEIRCSSVGLLVFGVFFHAMQQWHPYGFRYFVLVAPWMAVNSAWWLAGLAEKWRRWAWAMVLTAGAASAVWMLTQTHQAGWRAVTEPERSRNYHVYQEWRNWAIGLDQVGERLLIDLPFNRPLAAFYRLPKERRVQQQPASALAGVTAEEAMAGIGDGWLLVPALQFMGNEGRVRARIWLFDGEPGSPFSLAAYHRLSAGELEEPITYRHKIFPGLHQTSHELLVRAGASGRVRLRCESSVGESWRYVVTTPTEVRRGEWQGGIQEFPLTLPAGKAAEVVVVFQPVAVEPSVGKSPNVAIRP